jgi:hypothetical protein
MNVSPVHLTGLAVLGKLSAQPVVELVQAD